MDNFKIEIAKLYIVYFGRPPDPEGLQYWEQEWASRIANGEGSSAVRESVSNSFSLSDEAEELYPFLANPTLAGIDAFLDSVYQNMFNRDPDAGGAEYWAGQISENLQAGRPIGRILLDIINGAAPGNDTASLANKAEIAVEYVELFKALGITWNSELHRDGAKLVVVAVDETDQSKQNAEQIIAAVIGNAQNPQPPIAIHKDFGKVDPLASDDRNGDGVDEQMFYGTGNSNDAFSIVRHEGAGVELALKAKQFGPNGGDYSDVNRHIDENHVTHYVVNTGASPDNANRADWSIDFAGTVLPQGQDKTFNFKLWIDVNPASGTGPKGETMVEVLPKFVNDLFQGSTNYAFFRDFIDIDPKTDGVQPYNFGRGQFSITLEARDADDVQVATNTIVVHVRDWDLNV